MPSRTQRNRWQDVKKQDIPLENVLRAYLLHHEDRNHGVFFSELPCLKDDEPQANRLLNAVYSTRSKHFHDARFLAGELHQWHPAEFLMPDPMAYRTTYERLTGLVNGLLIAVSHSQDDRKLNGSALSPDFLTGREARYSLCL
jgi:hypothetical protein